MAPTLLDVVVPPGVGPGETVEFTDALGAVDVDAALVADRCVRTGVAEGLVTQLLNWYDAIETVRPYRFDAEQAHRRRRAGACLKLLSL